MPPPPFNRPPRNPGTVLPDRPGMVIEPGRPIDPRIPGMLGDPGLLGPGRFEFVLKEVAPLLMLPLRLEYRLVETSRKLLVATTPNLAVTRDKIFARRSGNDPQTVKKRNAELTRLRNKALSSFRPEAPVLDGRRELWFRWFPDADFAQAGIAPPSPDELAALAAFQAAAAPKWWALSDAATSSAWQSFVQTVGPFRALHLARQGATATGNSAAIGRIALLPKQVSLFTLIGGQPELVATGADIPSNVGTGAGPIAYTPDALEPGGWLSDFEIAIANGMGVKITDPAMIDKALAAEWIAAVGISAANAPDELTALVRDGIAGGGFAILKQDSPTNNTPGERTPLRTFRDDPVGFLAQATEDERGFHDSRIKRSADILADALGIDLQLVRKSIGGADTAFADARAMLRVIAPGILDGAYDGNAWGQDLDENDVIDIIASAIAARGALPAVRFGKNPYGILPVTLGATFAVETEETFSNTERKVFGILQRVGTLLRPALAQRAEQGAARLRPDAPEVTAAAFEAILQNARVSRRVELVDDDTGDLQGLGCAYVAGAGARNAAPRADRQPMSYLAALRSKRPSDLPDPHHRDLSWPLLYRLARLTLTRNVSSVLSTIPVSKVPKRLQDFEKLPEDEQKKALQTFERFAGEIGLTIGGGADRAPGRTAPGRVTEKTIQLAQRLFRAFDEGLAQLSEIAARPNGVAELETLMLEVFDLLQHRVDAWLTGIAYARLARRRAAGGTGLVGGYWGLLGRLRPDNPLADADGYIQAPSIAQASTAALLRSAYRRHAADGVFNLDLSSRRVRRGMAVMDHLAAGSSLAAVLGLRAERLLRDQPQDKSYFIPTLRRDFPIRTESPPETESNPAAPSGRAGEPMLDGLALLEANPSRFPREQRSTMAMVKATLSDDLDAVTDIIMAEAVHHRAMGAAETANAWLNVLSGGTLPGRPIFLRTRRPGHASSHRVSVIFPPASPVADPSTVSPRVIAEPGAAALAEVLVGTTAAMKVRVEAVLVSDPVVKATLDFTLGTLGMSAMDLMIGGASELDVRARAAFVQAWRQGEAAALGSLPDVTPPGDIVAFTVIPDPADGKTAKAILRLDYLRRVLGQGRPIEPGDFNAAANATLGTLDPAVEANLLWGAAAELDDRIRRLAQALDQVVTDFSGARRALESKLLQLQVEVDRDAASPAAAAALIQVRNVTATLAALAQRVAAFAEPTALRPLSVLRLLDPADDNRRRLVAIENRLRSKQLHLAALGPAAITTRPEEARAALSLRIAALRSALDGDALPVMPVYAPRAETTPVLTNGAALPAGITPLSAWGPVRGRIASLLGVLKDRAGGLKLYQVTNAASVTPADFAEEMRSEAEAPRSLHFGLFLSISDPAQATAPHGGIVADEWVETRASDTQDAALALNYDTPGAQAPNAILLCVPPSSTWHDWSNLRAAQMVAEVTDLMRLRALTSDQRIPFVAMSPGANSVPHKGGIATSVPRIPEKQLSLMTFVRDISAAGLFMVDAQSTPGSGKVGIEAAGLNVSPGFTRRKD